MLSTKWEKYPIDLTDERSLKDSLTDFIVTYQRQFLSCDQCTGVMEDITMGKLVRGTEELCTFSVTFLSIENNCKIKHIKTN